MRKSNLKKYAIILAVVMAGVVFGDKIILAINKISPTLAQKLAELKSKVA